jgi:hypothetical protein
MSKSARDMEAEEHVSLCEALDRVLNAGVVIVGEVVISVADIDLVYLSLQVMLSSVETAREISAQNAANRPCPAGSKP